MDGRTERILIARPRLHSMLRGKNRTIVSSFVWTQYRNVTDSDIHHPMLLQRSALGAVWTAVKVTSNLLDEMSTTCWF